DSAKNKTCARPQQICFAICASSMRSVSILSLRNEFPLWGSVPRFLIGSSVRRTTSLSRQACLNKSFEERVRFVWFALEFGMILAADEIRVIAQLNQFGERAIG